MVASTGRVLLTWMRKDANDAYYRYAIAQGVGSANELRTLGIGPLFSSFV
jgi:hypothetical protein